jgi:hypothetical protein
MFVPVWSATAPAGSGFKLEARLGFVVITDTG